MSGVTLFGDPRSIGAMAPNRRSDLARFGLRAMLGGAIACCLTGCVAGLLLP